MGTLPPRARKRLRVIDADTPDLETIDPTTLEFDDENRLCVVETVLALETSAEREAAIEERRRAYRKSYVLLKPAALAAYHAMADALRGHGAEIARRLESTRNDLLLMSVRMPDNMWADAFHAALKTLVPFITSSHPGVDPSFTVAIPQSERWHGTEYSFQPEPIMRDLMKTHVVMLHGPEVAVPSTLSSLVDVSIDLADMPAKYLELAIVRSFELDEPKIWLGPDVSRLKPSLFDAACARAPDWTEVAPILNRLARAELDDEALVAKEKEKSEKKPSTSASKTAFVPEVLHPTEPTLDMLSGYGAFAEWAKDAARDVADYRAGRLAWSDVDVGCLLHGPPGTGKTFAARAFAATCGLPFMPVSFAQWTASGRSYQGDVIAAMRATFAAAASVIRKLQPDLWIHGHTHAPHDYDVGTTRIVCNPRGYAHRIGHGRNARLHFENPHFDPRLVIDVGVTPQPKSDAGIDLDLLLRDWPTASAMDRLDALAAEHPDARIDVAGGLLDDDDVTGSEPTP